MWSYSDGPEDYPFTQSEKTVKVCRNGEPTHFFSFKIKSEYKPADIIKLISSGLNFDSVQKFRLFTMEGVEIYPTELTNLLKDGDTIFASKGEDFDKNSTLAEYDILSVLGEGGFGSVYLARHKQSNEKVALKILKNSALTKAHEIDRQYAEAETLKNLRHKNIVTVLTCFTLQNRRVAFVMEYLEGGELLEYVQKRKRLPEEEAKEFFVQIADAIGYCHRHRIIHCDLKLENLLLEAKDNKHIKVIDFGISGVNSNVKTKLDAGSLDYMAPELFGESPIVHPGVDIWAMGCILFGMVCGYLPFQNHDHKETLSKAKHGDYSYGEHGANFSQELKELISRMLQPDPASRINIHEIIDHPWLNGQKIDQSGSRKDSLDSLSNPSLIKNIDSNGSVSNINGPSSPTEVTNIKGAKRSSYTDSSKSTSSQKPAVGGTRNSIFTSTPKQHSPMVNNLKPGGSNSPVKTSKPKSGTNFTSLAKNL